MKCAFLEMSVLFIPSNDTETCQPLDLCFIALMKSLMRAMRNTQNDEHVFDLLQTGGGSHEHPSKLSEVGEFFY